MLSGLRDKTLAPAMAWLVLLALLPRMLLPIGFMPVADPSPDGVGFHLTICRAAVAAGDESAPEPTAPDRGLCPFVFVLVWQVSDEPASEPTISAIWYPVPRLVSRQRLGLGRRRPGRR